MSAELKSDIRKCLKEQRPNLSDKSMSSYTSTLSNLTKKMLANLPKKMNETPNDCKFFSKNVDEIIEFLKDKPSNTRKSVLSPLVVLTGDDKYKKLMSIDMEKYSNQIKTQTKSEAQEKNWLKWDKILEIHNALKNKAQYNIKSKDYDMELLTQYVLLSMFVLIPPRRVLDYSKMKIRNWNKDTDNFIDVKKKTITFNIYKTFKKYGTQTFSIPDEMVKLVKQWQKINNNSDWLLLEELDSYNVTRMFNKLFAKATGKSNVSSNILRHSFLTNYYNNITAIPSLVVMENLATQMSHSVSTQLLYIKS